MNSNLAQVWLLVIASTFFWGSNFNAGHAVALDTTPLTAAAERFGVALVLFWFLRFAFGKSESQLSLLDIVLLVGLGLLGVFGFNVAFFTALHTTSALNAALIMALSPMTSVLFSLWLLKTPIKYQQYAGMMIAFFGVTLVITGGHFAVIHIALGDAWMFLACCLWSLYNVGAKKFANHIPSLQFARWTVSAGALGLIGAAFALEQPRLSLMNTSLQSHVLLIYMGVCGSVFAYIFWLRGVYALGPAKSSIAFNLMPVFTLLISLMFGVVPNLAQLIGMFVVFAGVIIATG